MITTGNGLLRTYEWDGVTRSLQLFPPGKGPGESSSFYSRRYDANGVRIPSYDWVDHKGITRGEAWEMFKNFHSSAEAAGWLEGENCETMPAVWTNDGLVVAWSTGVDYKSLTIEVHQILINGMKPNVLPGSSDSKFVR